jgi:hypothetical protein
MKDNNWSAGLLCAKFLLPLCAWNEFFCATKRALENEARLSQAQDALSLSPVRSHIFNHFLMPRAQRRIQRNVSTWPNEEMKNVEKRVDHDGDDDGPRQCVN